MKLSRCAAAVIGALPSLAAWAQTAPPTALPQVVVTGNKPGDKFGLDDTQSTASRLPMTPRQTPASVFIIDREAIDARGATNTQEILAGAPGLSFASPPGSAGSVVYRGFGSSQLTQLFNGITVQYDAIAARPVDSWIYERVEVIGGPSTFLFGAGAVGGSINYLTKTPQRDLDFAEGLVSYGSFNTVNLALGVNRRLGSGGGDIRNTVRLDVNRSSTDGWVDGQQRTALNAAASLATDFGSRWSHLLALEYQKETVDRPYWGTPLLNPTTGDARIDPATRFKNYNSADGLYEQTVTWARSVTQYRASEATQIRNTLYHYDALRDYRNVEVYRFTADNSQVTGSSPLLQRHDQNLLGNRLEITHKGALAGRSSDWAGGLDYSVNNQTRFPRSLSLTVSTVNPTDFVTEPFFSIPGMSPGFVPDRTNRVTTFALFLENRTRLTDRLALVSGLRRDQIDLEVTNKRTASATDPAYFQRQYTPLTGRAGLVFDLGPTANLYAQYSTAADPPAGILTTASFSQVRDFDLTTGKQWEAGSKFDFADGRGSATLAAYRITRRNLAVADPANPGTTIPVGQQSSHGLEMAASWRPSREWLLQGNLAVGSARYDDFTENVSGAAVSRVGNTPTNVPKRVANLFATWQFHPAWSATVDVRHVSARFGNTANTIRDPAYTLLGASVSWKVTPTATLVLRGRNLTDKVYAASLTGTPMSYLGAPRSFELALRARF